MEWYSWHSKVTEARAVIATELAISVANALIRLRTTDCVERRLDALARTLDVAAKSGALPPVGTIGSISTRQYPGGVWQGVLASQTATHFPRLLLADLAATYARVNKADELALVEANSWTDLNTMVGPGRRLDPPSEDRLRAALGHAHYYNQGITTLGMRIIQGVQKMGISFAKDGRVWRKVALRIHRDKTQVCQPCDRGDFSWQNAA